MVDVVRSGEEGFISLVQRMIILGTRDNMGKMLDFPMYIFILLKK